MTQLEEQGSAPTPRPPRRRPAPIPEETRKEIIELHGFYGTREIAKRVGLSRKIVRRVLREEGCTPPPRSRRRGQASLLDPFREQVQEKAKKGLTISRILREIKEAGYQGGRTILAEYVRSLAAQPTPAKRAKRRFETAPGLEMQIDWSPYWVEIDGRRTKVHALGCLLGCSRKLFVFFFADEKQSTLLEGLAMAFAYFGGVPIRVVLDNMTQAILGRVGSPSSPLWHPRFAEFFEHYGFKPFACRVRDPDRKGKKEKSFRLVWDDFLKGSSFTSWEDLNARAAVWLDHTKDAGNLRVHGTTRQVPNEAWCAERDFLIALPSARFPTCTQEVRLVDRDATISVSGTCYTVPDHLADRSVSVRLYAFHFEVLDLHGSVVFSRRYVEAKDKGKLIIDTTHYRPLAAEQRRAAASGKLEEQLLVKFPELEALIIGIKKRMTTLAPIHFSALVKLASRYGDEAFLPAAGRAQQYRRFDGNAVRRILEREHPLPEGDGTVSPIGTAAASQLLGEVEPATFAEFDYLENTPPTVNPEGADHGA